MPRADYSHDIRMFPVMAAVMQLGAALMTIDGPGRPVLWILCAIMSLHAIHPFRSTPLIAAVLAPLAFRGGHLLPADTILTGAAYIFFCTAYELEGDTHCRIQPAEPAEPLRKQVLNPVNHDVDMDDL